MTTNKSKKNSSLNASSFVSKSLVSDALKLKKDKPAIGDILQEQNHLKGGGGAEPQKEQVPSPPAIKVDQTDMAAASDVKSVIPITDEPATAISADNNDQAITQGKENEAAHVNTDEVAPVLTTPKTEQPSNDTAPVRKRKQINSYERFLIANRNVQKGKAIYIRTDFHSKIENIVNMIGEKGLTLAAYIDNIMTAHFEQFDAEINSKKQEALQSQIEALRRS